MAIDRNFLDKESWFDRHYDRGGSRFLSTPHGKMHYIDCGEGPLTVLVHGTPGWSYEWRQIIKKIPGRVIALDHVGFGLSDRPRYPLTLEDHVANFKLLLDSLLDGLKGSDISFILHDFGGPIALESLLYKSYMIKKLILINTWYWPLHEGDPRIKLFQKAMKLRFLEDIYDIFGLSARYLTKWAWGESRAMTKADHKSFYRMLPRGLRQGTIGFLRSALHPRGFYGDYAEKLRAIEGLPCLLIWGRRDPLLSESHLQKWQQILPEMPAILLSRAGHWPHLEDYESVGETIGEFLSPD